MTDRDVDFVLRDVDFGLLGDECDDDDDEEEEEDLLERAELLLDVELGMMGVCFGME